MTISVARLTRLAASATFGCLLLLAAQPLLAQPTTTDDDRETTRLNRRIASMIRSIDEIKWSNVTIYRLEDEFRNRLTKGMEAEDKADLDYIEGIGQTVSADPLPDFGTFSMSTAASGQGAKYPTFKAAMARHYNVDADELDDAQLQNAYARARSVIAKRAGRPREFYLVTSRDRTPIRLISLLGVRTDDATGSINITKYWAGTELYTYLRTNTPDTTMYTELKSAAVDGNPALTNQMFALRDLSEIEIVHTTKARATYLDENKYMYVLTGISEGRPIRGAAAAPVADSTDPNSGGGGLFDVPAGGGGGLFGDAGGSNKQGNAVINAQVPGTAEYPYEITVGTDVLAGFRAYDMKTKPVPSTRWGVDLRNNLDELNYPSIWGGRLTLNAILENVRIGAVLPGLRFGGKTIDSSGIGPRPQKILGSYGVAFGGDFTAPLLDNSGLFNFFATYAFGDPSLTKVRPFNIDQSVVPNGETGYLIRYAFQAFYSFGFYADAAATHLFRLKIGGTTYGVDSYVRHDTTQTETGAVASSVAKTSSQSIGGVSGRIEYMHSGVIYPFGAWLQYIDQSVLSDVWLQFVVARNIDLKFDLKFFSPIFRDPHAWEDPNVVVPAVTIHYHF